MNPCESLSSP